MRLQADRFLDQHAGVVSGPVGDRLIRRERRVQRAAAEAFQHLPDHRHPRCAAGRQHNVDVRPAEALVFEQLHRELLHPVDQVFRQPFELRDFHLVRLALSAGLAGQGGLRTDGEAAFSLLDLQRQSLQVFDVSPPGSTPNSF